ncbi:hypothetical protein ACLBWZ_15900, partial [Brucellaceae bacterium C25G]
TFSISTPSSNPNARFHQTGRLAKSSSLHPVHSGENSFCVKTSINRHAIAALKTETAAATSGHWCKNLHLTYPLPCYG